MDYYEGVVLNYLRADRAVFVNTECCLQLTQADNPDASGPHWYCDAVAADFRAKKIFLCEVSYAAQLADLSKRLKSWNDHWEGICAALVRDSKLLEDWPVRPWLFVPEDCVPSLLKRLAQIGNGQPLRFTPLITTLEMVQPWKYASWNRQGEKAKPAIIPELMAK